MSVSLNVTWQFSFLNRFRLTKCSKLIRAQIIKFLITTPKKMSRYFNCQRTYFFRIKPKVVIRTITSVLIRSEMKTSVIRNSSEWWLCGTSTTSNSTCHLEKRQVRKFHRLYDSCFIYFSSTNIKSLTDTGEGSKLVHRPKHSKMDTLFSVVKNSIYFSCYSIYFSC